MTLTVRRATTDDVYDVTRMGLAFLGTHPVGPFDPEYVPQFAEMMVTEHLALVAEISGHTCGMLLAVNRAALFHPTEKVWQEIAWWTDLDARSSGAGGALLDAFENIVGNGRVCMGTMPTTEVEAQYFIKRGWTLTHQVWTKGF
jgi:hypothetical protein